MESEVPPSDNTTGITAVLVNETMIILVRHSPVFTDYLVTMSSDTRLDCRGSELKSIMSNGREDGGGSEGREDREGRAVLGMSGVNVLVTVTNLVLCRPSSSTWKE